MIAKLFMNLLSSVPLLYERMTAGKGRSWKEVGKIYV
jgi:hypothetical protein